MTTTTMLKYVAILGAFVIVAGTFLLFFLETEEARTASSIVGSWQSSEDAQSIARFKEDGTLDYYYGPEDLGSGTWEVYKSELDILTLRIYFDNEDFVYSILEADESNLVLSYLVRGITLHYLRI